MTQSTIQRLESSEEPDTIQLNSLRRLAEGLECELVYVLVPRGTLSATYDAAARRELARVSHSMALEDQAVDDAAEDERLRRLITE